ncbi:TIM-barrel domain-containing protein [Bifidobacterium crudilactis]|jgi:alpha-glucosidase (family GH31 glycosyl hydrolase)|uniref:glycoside hydrolase family 31 protein n=1 Tax=Bifidobacterium crudilactis TaxID=327277 RepID=UPI0023547288|nr:TIM-barrel domain-containing protein [Bifidobacterium crudilactis]MCI1218869.1 alpha-glucosidase [Bifidobacterium crudilactis]
MKESQALVAFTPTTEAGMNPDAIVQGECWRIGILDEALLRFEWSDDGVFENLPTQIAWNRSFGPTPEYRVTHHGDLTIIDTDALHVTYDGKPFSKEGLSVVVKGVDSQFNTWHYGERSRGNLRGTARTLDEADGAIPLGEGLCSRDGWAVIDDSASKVLAPADRVKGEPNPYGSWIFPREHQEQDLYFFGYGHRYRDAVKAFYALSGHTPLLPRFVFGNWWSRFYKYDAAEYLALMGRFVKEGLPFTTAVIDMDWHVVDVDPKYGSGWTGYTWNRELFPDPEGFLSSLHRRGMKVTLNVHPRDGIRAFEEGYAKAAESMGIEPGTGQTVDFDLTRPRFVQAYADLHHDLERQGVDFWWLDWQQGGVTRMQGLDPLWMLNHLHYLDSGREGRWPLTFSRYAGPGSHRYPIGFSGDTLVSWDSLKFQPCFTATASNIGYGWWSHDIGGHMYGSRDEELEARWYQLGTFSPINRLHSSASSFNTKEPWNFHAEVRSVMDEALKLRHRLIPYLYTMNWRAAYDGEPLVEPMYWQHPEIEESYEVPNQFRFGTQLIVAPITEPVDTESRLGHADVWFPQGEYFDFFDGRRYLSSGSAGRMMQVWRPLDRIPVFAKAGGIVPLQQLPPAGAEAGRRINDVSNPESLTLVVFPGDNGKFVLREDDGTFPESADFAKAAEQAGLVETTVTLDWHVDGARLSIVPDAGSLRTMPDSRNWQIILRGVEPTDARVFVDGIEARCDLSYDADTSSMRVDVHGVRRSSHVDIDFTDVEQSGVRLRSQNLRDEVFDILFDAQMPYLTKEKVLAAVDADGMESLSGLRALNRGPRRVGDLQWSHLPDSVMAAIEEVMLRSRR